MGAGGEGGDGEGGEGGGAWGRGGKGKDEAGVYGKEQGERLLVGGADRTRQGSDMFQFVKLKSSH